MSTQTHWYLQQIDLFQGVSDEEIMEIASNATAKHCSKRELLYSPLDVSNSICLLKKGEVTLYNSHRGRKLIIDVLKPGSIFGNISFQEDQNLGHYAEVTEDALICVFPLEDFMKILQAKPKLMMRFLQIVSGRLSDYENRMKSGLFDAKEKILHHIEIIQEKSQKSLLSRLFKPTTKTHITHEKLADHTGLTRETVTRAVNDLRREGVLQTNEKGQVVI